MNVTSWKIWIDTGGTFTDCIAVDPSGHSRNLKVLSSGILRLRIKGTIGTKVRIDMPLSLATDFFKGFKIRVGKEIRTVVHFSPSLNELTVDRTFRHIDAQSIAEIYTGEEVPIFAARVLTGTSMEKDFPQIEMKLGSTRGTNALLERKGAKTIFLVTKGFKDLILIGDQQRRNLFALNIVKPLPLYHKVIEVSERIESDGSVNLSLAEEEIERVIAVLKKEKALTVAIALLNSYSNSIHEQLLGNALKHAGISYTSLSHQLSSQIKILHRAETAIVNAYLDPIIHKYISNIRSQLKSASIKIMSSAGGLLSADDFRPKDSLLSGPAGGVIGALKKAKLSGVSDIITFDMGGTSTDVSRCNDRPDYRFDCTVGNLRILTPSVNIETIAAGGGSICAYDGFKLVVGPESAGANPGPACYDAGGPLSITDINLLLGRLDPDNFSIPINIEKSRIALQNIVEKIRRNRRQINPTAVLESFIEIANEKMAEAIRKISIQRGHDPKDYALLCFGGAGGQHACSLATLLGIRQVIIPYDAGLLSAYGIGHSTLESVKEKLVLKKLPEVLPHLERDSNILSDDAREDLIKNGVSPHSIFKTRRLIFLRLKGQETSLEVEWNVASEIETSFINQYRKLYDHWLETRDIEVESIRVIVAAGNDYHNPVFDAERRYKPKPEKIKRTRVSGSWIKCPVFKWENLLSGAHVKGPALLLSESSTLFIEEGWTFVLDKNNNGIIRFANYLRNEKAKGEEARLELFTNRFTAIAEEMGTLLQRTSFSVNVKERLDFSCALLDRDGNLVVNAPHIPVHLGSMGVCVRSVVKEISVKDGDVIITNHPAYGGSHLPDITLIKPVFFKKALIGFVANRAHHAEVGGIRPGSMPSNAVCLEEEGVVIPPTYLVRNGNSQWEVIRSIFMNAPYPTRALEENLADLNGALMSLKQGADSLTKLCELFGPREVLKYMRLLRRHASTIVSEKIRQLRKLYQAEEYLDDGSKLKVRISKKRSGLHIDFSGSSPMHKGNLNASPAIVNSVILYVLRLLVDESLPLNEGLLENVRIRIPTGILNPVFDNSDKLSPAVVGGNTEISQRLTDTLLKALKLSACSQGTMNNFLFGNEKFGYYETICGGVGAGPGFNGASAVHQHMTNTRITDPEILEFRYGVRLERFEIRRGSGGPGKWSGGDGVERQFYFKEPFQVSMLSQHRHVAPFGMNGGLPGKTGEQFLIRDNKRKKLSGTDGITVHPGDRIVIKTPGGGGWGKIHT
jgi:5-oxoprolinase (ATP-hydrolysing)